jgi:signal transduction histidine kinase
LTIADDGPGVPPDQRGRIFERFTRLDDGRSRDAGGTGLGLAITHDIVVLHGGTIRVDNAPGARFIVSFPAAG